MKLAIDVHYRQDFAKVVSVEFDNWQDATPLNIHSTNISDFLEYEPGAFYKRELPCILEILKESDITKIDCIIVDGYVILDDDGKHGLGAYLYESLLQKIPIIGVAKRSYINNKKHVREVFRGNSKNPLYISSIGIDLDQSATYVQEMHGQYRMPDLLRIMDQHTKS